MEINLSVKKQFKHSMGLVGRLPTDAEIIAECKRLIVGYRNSTKGHTWASEDAAAFDNLIPDPVAQASEYAILLRQVGLKPL